MNSIAQVVSKMRPGMNWRQVLGAMLQRAQHINVTKVVLATNLVLVALLAYSLATMTWAVLPKVAQNQNVPVSAGSAATPQPSQRQYSADDIVRWHLFGIDAPVAESAVPTVMPETTLNLVLRGVLASDDPKIARAIISEPSGDEGFYAIGALLPGNAELKEIHPDRIVLFRSGRYETLRLPEDRMDKGGESRPGANQQSPLMEPDFEPEQEPDSSGLEPGPSNLGQYRDSLLKNPQSIAGLLQAEPVYQNGQFSGYKLGNTQDVRMLAKFGLRRGDVITAINGTVLDDPSKVPEVLRSLSSAKEVRVEYLRNNGHQSTVLRME